MAAVKDLITDPRALSMLETEYKTDDDVLDAQCHVMQGYGWYVLNAIQYTGYSDYSGSFVEMSNYKWFEDNFGDCPWLHYFYGGHGSACVAVNLNYELKEDDDQDKVLDLEDALRALSDYPSMDDEGWYMLEFEATAEAWPDYGEWELIRELEKRGVEIEGFTFDQLLSLSENFPHEAWGAEIGCSIWFDIDMIADKLMEEQYEMAN